VHCGRARAQRFPKGGRGWGAHMKVQEVSPIPADPNSQHPVGTHSKHTHVCMHVQTHPQASATHPASMPPPCPAQPPPTNLCLPSALVYTKKPHTTGAGPGEQAVMLSFAACRCHPQLLSQAGG
jgi:hypothetical protein